MTAPRRYDKITPGPASRMVMLLPRNRPTPIAPPRASMVSWRGVSRRCRFSGGDETLAGELSRRCAGRGASGIAAHWKDYVAEAMDFFYSVVMYKRHADCARLRVQTQPPHESRCIHVPIANSDARIRQCLGDPCRMLFLKVETKSGDAFAQPIFIADAIDCGAGLFQDAQQFRRECCLVSPHCVHGNHEVAPPGIFGGAVRISAKTGPHCFYISFRGIQTRT